MKYKNLSIKKKYKKPEVQILGNVMKHTWGSISGGNDSGASFHNTGGSNS